MFRRNVSTNNNQNKSRLESNFLGSIIGQFKSVCTKKIWQMGLNDFRWQARFYDYIIRNDDSAIALLTQLLLPQALIVTPNRYEAQILSKQEINTVEDMKQAAVTIQQQLGVKVVLIKGGGLIDSAQSIDVWFDGNDWQFLRADRVKTKNTHGTGCTFSSAIAANIASGKDLLTAVQDAKHYVTIALKNSLTIGEGNGPVGHFFPIL